MKTQTRDKDIVGTYLRVCTLQGLLREISAEVNFLAEEQKQVLRTMNRAADNQMPLENHDMAALRA